MLVQRPHLHGDPPAGSHGEIPKFFQDYLAIGALEVVVAFHNMRLNITNIGEGLVDKVFHRLKNVLDFRSMRYSAGGI